jgi:hypothetical protein
LQKKKRDKGVDKAMNRKDNQLSAISYQLSAISYQLSGVLTFSVCKAPLGYFKKRPINGDVAVVTQNISPFVGLFGM